MEKLVNLLSCHKLIAGLCLSAVFFGLISVSVFLFDRPALSIGQYSKSIDISSLVIPPDIKEQRDFWRGLIEQYGGREAYRVFGLVNDEFDASSHTLAHVFGEALYEVEGMEGVKICDTHFRFGCYHSFFGIAIYNEGITMLPELDALCREEYGEIDTRCQHGLGHGLLVYTGYENLLQAIELCASLPSWQPTGSCAGGVFMEYNFHTMEESEGTTYTRDSSGDLYEPCSSLPEEFQPSCYHEQVQWWLTVFDNDFEYVGSLCVPLRDNPISWDSCYQRIGNFITEFRNGDYDTIIEMCSKMENDTADHLCREGSTYPMTAIAAYRETKLRLCDTLSSEVQKRCFATVDDWGF